MSFGHILLHVLIEGILISLKYNYLQYLVEVRPVPLGKVFPKLCSVQLRGELLVSCSCPTRCTSKWKPVEIVKDLNRNHKIFLEIELEVFSNQFLEIIQLFFLLKIKPKRTKQYCLSERKNSFFDL